jgi:hypothetical protein
MADESNTAASTLNNDGDEKKPVDHGGHINLKVKGQVNIYVSFSLHYTALQSIEIFWFGLKDVILTESMLFLFSCLLLNVPVF